MSVSDLKFLENNLSGKMLEILEYKLVELENKKNIIPLATLQGSISKTNFVNRSLVEALKMASGISLIAEIKRASPSLPRINLEVNIMEQARIYEKAGANVISVLTDEHFFKGSLDHLKEIRGEVNLPLLRKDFIFDEYQIYEAKLFGADAVLLIASILNLEKLQELILLARDLGLDSLIEVHSQRDLDKALKTDAEIIGINARNLTTFEIDLQNILNLTPLVPHHKIVVAESGISSRYDVEQLQKVGIRSILVGTVLMQANDITQKIKELKLL